MPAFATIRGAILTSYLFSGGRFLDPRRDELMEGVEVLVESGMVKEVSDRPIKTAGAQRVDLGGRTLMPGLIDAHWHAMLIQAESWPGYLRRCRIQQYCGRR
jgi:imidazolonepropionase-like amidohydrolase